MTVSEFSKMLARARNREGATGGLPILAAVASAFLAYGLGARGGVIAIIALVSAVLAACGGAVLNRRWDARLDGPADSVEVDEATPPWEALKVLKDLKSISPPLRRRLAAWLLPRAEALVAESPQRVRGFLRVGLIVKTEALPALLEERLRADGE